MNLEQYKKEARTKLRALNRMYKIPNSSFGSLKLYHVPLAWIDALIDSLASQIESAAVQKGKDMAVDYIEKNSNNANYVHSVPKRVLQAARTTE